MYLLKLPCRRILFKHNNPTTTGLANVGVPGGYKAKRWFKMRLIISLLCYLRMRWRVTVAHWRKTQQPAAASSWTFLVVGPGLLWAPISSLNPHRESPWSKLLEKTMTLQSTKTEIFIEYRGIGAIALEFRFVGYDILHYRYVCINQPSDGNRIM